MKAVQRSTSGGMLGRRCRSRPGPKPFLAASLFAGLKARASTGLLEPQPLLAYRLPRLTRAGKIACATKAI